MNRKTIFLCLIFSFASFAFLNTASAQSPSPKAPTAKEMVQRQAILIGKAMERSKIRIVELTKRIDSGVSELNTNSVSDIAYEDVVRMLHLQKVELMIDLEGLDARLKLLKDETAKAVSDSNSDEVSRTQRQLLERYVANQTQERDKLKKLAAKGAVGQQRMVRSGQLLIEAKLKLKEFDAKRKSVSPAFVQAMFETTLSIGEKKARLAAVETMLDSHTGSRKDVSAIEELRMARESEKSSMQDLIEELRRIELKGSQF